MKNPSLLLVVRLNETCAIAINVNTHTIIYTAQEVKEQLCDEASLGSSIGEHWFLCEWRNTIQIITDQLSNY